LCVAKEKRGQQQARENKGFHMVQFFERAKIIVWGCMEKSYPRNAININSSKVL